MGHYASEMAGPAVRHEPEVLIERREDTRRHAAFRWDLQRKYEEQGVWVRADETLVCPHCFAMVPALLRVDHDEAVHQ